MNAIICALMLFCAVAFPLAALLHSASVYVVACFALGAMSGLAVFAKD